MIAQLSSVTDILKYSLTKLNFQVFDRIRENYPERLQKLRIVKGDVTQEALGLSEGDIKDMASCVSVVFHCAANVRFDQPLKGACNMNTQGTFRTLTVAENFKKLDVSQMRRD